ncbi:MAG: cytochrome c [Gemmatimonadetes bacterium]|nr:cytochrome c [Gemmatimonadota bacterium]
MPSTRSRLLPLVTFAATATFAAACSTAATTPSVAPQAAAAPAAPAPPARPAEVTPAAIAEGDSLYAAGSCTRCHGIKGIGTARGPSLVTGPWLQHTGSYAEIVTTITNGVPRGDQGHHTPLPDECARWPDEPHRPAGEVDGGLCLVDFAGEALAAGTVAGGDVLRSRVAARRRSSRSADASRRARAGRCRGRARRRRSGSWTTAAGSTAR